MPTLTELFDSKAPIKMQELLAQFLHQHETIGIAVTTKDMATITNTLDAMWTTLATLETGMNAEVTPNTAANGATNTVRPSAGVNATELEGVNERGEYHGAEPPTKQTPIGSTVGLQPRPGSDASVPTEGDTIATARAAEVAPADKSPPEAVVLPPPARVASQPSPSPAPSPVPVPAKPPAPIAAKPS